MPNTKDARARGRRPAWMQAAVELCVVGGASVVFVAWLAPNYIAAGSNLGLPPAMLPTTCAVAIAVLAIVQFGFALFARDGQRAPDERTRGQTALVVGLVLAAIGASILIDYAGMIVAGGVMTGLASVLLGERRVIVLATMALAGAAVMFVVAWSGL